MLQLAKKRRTNATSVLVSRGVKMDYLFRCSVTAIIGILIVFQIIKNLSKNIVVDGEENCTHSDESHGNTPCSFMRDDEPLCNKFPDKKLSDIGMNTLSLDLRADIFR